MVTYLVADIENECRKFKVKCKINPTFYNMHLKLTMLTSEGILKILVSPRSTKQPHDVNDC